MRALFGRKVEDYNKLKELTRFAWHDGMRGEEYVVTKEVALSDEEFKRFSDNLIHDQPWITSEDGGADENGALKCIRVINQLTGDKILVSNEGHTYPRYSAIEV